jgi:hypothetical protein
MPSDAVGRLERKDWAQASVSTLVDHGPCCAAARGWIVATSRSLDFAATDGLTFAAPRWLTRRWKWGPTCWPIAWCEAVRAEAIDCGVFGAFAREIFRAKGVQAYGGQVLRECAKATTAHWRARWAAVPGAFDWIGENTVYHEVCIIQVGPAEARVYDPTDATWLECAIDRGHGGHLAIRAEVPIALSWGPHMLVNGQWTEVDRHV